ncbi:DCC1-like thiol-disulfide oxidoreductase family protein [Pseudovibrio exalbescens]|uniref:DCC1-like thiol-disulfide oxidoreductase family protein n=1 Tax=Pseudovibrio exalbescens TaxID=197461 RepID=UPI002366B342|nr:DCC1-like thiol-disulfide oxidoreductase family protein [Pseudovibrio exalbescens]MDD7910020.1 DCC1-like thiol-disulfide oxidoreductase family protein [Pseudovibrio exalbescens]
MSNSKSIPDTHSRLLHDGATDTLTLIYDGACPFCQRYTTLLELREEGRTVTLIDARAHPQIVADLMSRGIDIDQTMVAHYQGREYAGSDALHLIALLATGSTGFNRLNRWLFRSQQRARLAYPVLRALRNGTLKLLGHRKIRS